MRKIEIEELKQIQLNILKDVHDFCIERGLRYSLGGGTLLGAVRHKGYIPWDDDIDIMMPRPDYDIFVKEFNSYKSHLICGAYENNKKFIYPYAKIYDNRTYWREEYYTESYGINIDLFSIDGFPNKNNKILFYSFCFLLKILLTALYVKIQKKSNWKNLIIFFVPLSYIKKINNKFFKIYKFDHSVFVGAVNGRYLEKECYLKKVFSEYMELDFETIHCMSIKDYDCYLCGHYGNYMQLPPIEQQIGHHTTEAYWKE
jgi:lipopolysaccharide cholinephosphotransferase